MQVDLATIHTLWQLWRAWKAMGPSCVVKIVYNHPLDNIHTDSFKQ